MGGGKMVRSALQSCVVVYYLPRQSRRRGRQKSIPPSRQFFSKVESAHMRAFEGIYPLQHSGVVGAGFKLKLLHTRQPSHSAPVRVTRQRREGLLPPGKERDGSGGALKDDRCANRAPWPEKRLHSRSSPFRARVALVRGSHKGNP